MGPSADGAEVQNGRALFSAEHEPLHLLHATDDLLNLGTSCYLSRPEEAQHRRQINHIDPIGLAISHGAPAVPQQAEVALLTECDGLAFTQSQIPGQMITLRASGQVVLDLRALPRGATICATLHNAPLNQPHLIAFTVIPA